MTEIYLTYFDKICTRADLAHFSDFFNHISMSQMKDWLLCRYELINFPSIRQFLAVLKVNSLLGMLGYAWLIWKCKHQMRYYIEKLFSSVLKHLWNNYAVIFINLLWHMFHLLPCSTSSVRIKCLSSMLWRWTICFAPKMYDEI